MKSESFQVYLNIVMDLFCWMKKKSLQSVMVSLFIMCLATNIGFGQSYSVFGQGQNPDVSKYDIGNIPTTIEGIQCDEVEHLAFHNHTKLVIKIQNETVEIPEGIGIIPNSCIFWLHTHDESGIIHMESPIEQSFTLGQFLNMWKEFDSSSYPKDLSAVSSSNMVNIIVDGNAVGTSSADFNKIVLKDNSVVSIDISDNEDTR